MKDGFADLVTSAQKEIATYEKWIEEKREEVAIFQPAVDELTELVKEIERVGPDGFEELRAKLTLDMLKIHAAKLQSMGVTSAISRAANVAGSGAGQNEG